ncbi:MAG: DUF6498-containing protein [Candidatus Limnocylindria bacterium]
MEQALALYRTTSSAGAAVLLVAVNLVPLAGVLWWGWDLAVILALYWIENGIVGAFNVLKILRAEGTALPGPSRMSLNGRPIEAFAKGPIALFFLVHYGAFWMGHGMFVLVFLPLMAGFGAGPGLGLGPDWSLVRLGAVGLAISHGASFWLNYLGRREYRSVSPGQLMLAPYGRLVILHLTIILGAMLSIWIGSPVGSLLVLVALKTALDLFFHLREHRRVAGAGPMRAPA